VHLGAAQAGLVALSQLRAKPDGNGVYWVIPEIRHSPILQDAVVLTRTNKQAAARSFLAYIKQPASQQILARYGYEQGGL